MKWHRIDITYDTTAYIRSKNKKEALKEVIEIYRSKKYSKKFLKNLKSKSVYLSTYKEVKEAIEHALKTEEVDIEKTGNVVLIQYM